MPAFTVNWSLRVHGTITLVACKLSLGISAIEVVKSKAAAAVFWNLQISQHRIQ